MGRAEGCSPRPWIMVRSRLLLGICLGISCQVASRNFLLPRLPSRTSLQGQATQGRASLRGFQPGARRLSPRTGRTSLRALAGIEAPVFAAKAVADGAFLDLSLSQFYGKKYVVLLFYPLDFTNPQEITSFSDRYSDFEAVGAEILGISVDSEYAHKAWIETPRESGGLGNVSFPLVSDLRKEIASAYGVLGPDGTARRGLFVIDKEGIVQHSVVNNLAVGWSTDEVLRVLQSIQRVQSPEEEQPEAPVIGSPDVEVPQVKAPSASAIGTVMMTPMIYDLFMSSSS